MDGGLDIGVYRAKFVDMGYVLYFDVHILSWLLRLGLVQEYELSYFMIDFQLFVTAIPLRACSVLFVLL